jgi:hypothetical protein
MNVSSDRSEERAALNAVSVVEGAVIGGAALPVDLAEKYRL